MIVFVVLLIELLVDGKSLPSFPLGIASQNKALQKAILSHEVEYIHKMPLTILSHSQLRSLLLSLTKEEIVGLQRKLAEALRQYSTGSQEDGCSSSYQPQRTAITRANGCTTLFMPASTGETIGMKMISLQDGDKAGCAVASGAHAGEEKGAASTQARSRAGRESIASQSSDTSGDPTTADSSDEDEGGSSTSNSVGARGSTGSLRQREASVASGTVNQQNLSETMGAWPGAGTRDTSPQGSVTLLDEESLPFGLINAHELTPFRTALVSTMLFSKRNKVKTLTVFGAGKQAYWHIRLALTLRSNEIKHVYIVNRSFERAAKLLQDIYSPDNSSWRGDVKFSAVSTDFGDYMRILNHAVTKADAIFCCTPSVEPLFPAELLASREGRRKGRLVSAIGSYKAHMTELHPDILRDEVHVHHSHRHWHKHTKRSGVVVVDSLDASLKEAGELIQADVKPHQAIEIGELLMVRDASLQDTSKQATDDSKSLLDWLHKGNVIFKGVGLGLMDLITGGDLVRLARERHLGTTVDEF